MSFLDKSISHQKPHQVGLIVDHRSFDYGFTKSAMGPKMLVSKTKKTHILLSFHPEVSNFIWEISLNINKRKVIQEKSGSKSLSKICKVC